jgi:hypothetical protein
VAVFLELVGDDGVDPVAQSRPDPQFAALLALQQFRIEHAGVYRDPGGDIAAHRSVGIESVPGLAAVWVRCPDLFLRDAWFAHAPPGVGLGHVPPFAGDSDGVLSRIGGDGR